MSVKRLAADGVLTAVSLIIFILESYIPPLVPIPGIKLGLANLVTLFVLIFMGGKDAFFILISRIILGAIFSGNPAALLYSLSGGLACLGMEALLIFPCRIKQVWAVSAVGAVMHNTVQLLIATWITRTPSVLVYLPFLWTGGLLTGLFNGLCIELLRRRGMTWLKRFLPK